jgi:hypothetical protein
MCMNTLPRCAGASPHNSNVTSTLRKLKAFCLCGVGKGWRHPNTHTHTPNTPLITPYHHHHQTHTHTHTHTPFWGNEVRVASVSDTSG